MKPSQSILDLGRSQSGDSMGRTIEILSRSEWRIRERIRTVSAGLILCLHLGVDPPDVLKTAQTARLECWTDPEETKAPETIVRNLQQQYEFWQPKARYKTLLDPNTEELRKLCTNLRKGAKEERVLLHYNGHGVPRPTRAGELWVFNKQFTQYIPVSTTEVANWMGTPSLVVIDSSAANNVAMAWQKLAEMGEDVLILAACSGEELLPMAPEMPADIFTACLTTPMEIAIRWHVYRGGPLMPRITLEMAMSIPGRLNDRRTPLGELNWILTAITDTVAWTILPREIFKKLFRQDVLVASLYRNYLLAIRILKYFRCTPQSWPLISTSSAAGHELWQAWDQALDCILSMVTDPDKPMLHESSPFFMGQMDAFELWIDQRTLLGPQSVTAIYLPTILQVLLSQTHRSRALTLLGHFADLGDWAVLDALQVGVFPYILKLFQSPSPDIRYSLLYLWLRILKFDLGVANDLIKDEAWQYFVRVLVDPIEEAPDCFEIRSMAAACLCLFIEGGGVIQGDRILIDALLTLANGPAQFSSEWALNLLSLLSFDAMSDIYCPVFPLLHHERCASRASAIHFIGKVLDESHDLEVNVEVIYKLLECISECHPAARRELIIALSRLVAKHSAKFTLAAYDLWHSKGKSVSVVAPGAGDMVRHPSICTLVWKACLILAIDPCEEVASVATQLVDEIHMGFLFKELPNESRASAQVVFVNNIESTVGSTTRSKSPARMSTVSLPITTEALVLKSAIPLKSNLIITSAEAHIEHQKRRREMTLRKNEHPVHAKTRKINLIDADDVRRWKSLNTKKVDQQMAVLNVGSPVTTVLFHPLEERVITTDSSGYVSTWDYAGRRVNSFVGTDPRTRITGIAWVDWDPIKLLVGTSEGIVRLYCDVENGLERMIAAWSTIGPSSDGSSVWPTIQCTLLEWNQQQRRLFTVTGGTQLTVLDAGREQIVERITLPETPVSALTSDRRESPIVTLGFADGWIRRYDLRQGKKTIASFMGTDTSTVVSVKQSFVDHELISASLAGEIVHWDLRHTRPTIRIPSRGTITSLDQHLACSLTAIGGDGIRFMDGETSLNNIRHYDGFLANKLGTVDTVIFHPRKLLVAAGCSDGQVPIYSARL